MKTILILSALILFSACNSSTGANDCKLQDFGDIELYCIDNQKYIKDDKGIYPVLRIEHTFFNNPIEYTRFCRCSTPDFDD